MRSSIAFTLYAAGLIQGVDLVAFPAASTILTDPNHYGLSSTAYGALFIPQALLSIAASAFNPHLIRKFGARQVFFGGIFSNLISMLLLAISALWIDHSAIAYSILITATSFLGLGFGLLVPTLNEMTIELSPDKSDSIVLLLNALLGIGTALSPLLIILFISLGFWWGLPALLSCLLTCLFILSRRLKLPEADPKSSHSLHQIERPGRFWLFASFALLYGIIETLNGNWVSIYMDQHLHAPIQIQSLALASFWGMVTFGRIFFSYLGRSCSEAIAFQTAPFITTAAFLLIASLSSNAEYFAVIAFGLTGFGCSVLLPLIISFGSNQLKAIAHSVPSMVITCYLLGYGIAAFGVGPLKEKFQISLPEIYLIGALIAFILGIISLVIIQNQPKETHG